MAIANGYATLAELRAYMHDTASVLTEAVAEDSIESASRWIDRTCGRWFYLEAAASARVYRPDDPYVAWVDDIGTTTGLVIKTDTTGDGTFATTWSSTDYQLEPLNADAVGAGSTVQPYAWWRVLAIDRYTFPQHAFRTTLQVTARYGWSAVPDDVKQACLIRAAALYERRNSPGGVHGLDSFGAPVRVQRSDPDVMALLGPYIKYGAGSI